MIRFLCGFFICVNKSCHSNYCFSQVNESTEFTELTNKEPWLSSTKLVVKPDMLFGKRGKSGLVALNLDLAQVAEFVKTRLGVEVISKIRLLQTLTFSFVIPFYLHVN